MHPDEIFRLDDNVARAVRSAIRALSAARLSTLLAEHRREPAALLAIAAWIRADDRLIVQHADVARENARDDFITALRAWAEDAGEAELLGRLERFRNLVRVIERGYRLISRSLDQLPYSRLPRERRLSAALHRAASDFEALVSRSLCPPLGNAIDHMAELAVPGDDGRPIGVDGMTAATAELVSNMIGFLAHGEWPSGRDGVQLPDPPLPTFDEIESAGLALRLSLSWNRWVRWEREARYWDGDLRPLREEELPDELRAIEGAMLYQHDRGPGAKRDWVAVERLKLQQRQNLAEFQLKYPVSYAGARSDRLPPDEFVDVAERLSASLVFAGTHLDPGDASSYAGASLREWLRGYSVLREIGQASLESRVGPDRHLIRLDRTELVERLTSAGLSAAGADAFVRGATYRKSSIDLFDSPLLWLGGDRFLAFGPSMANVEAGRAILSNLPSLGSRLDHKGHAFEVAVHAFLEKIGARPISPPKRKFRNEEYQIDVALPWGRHLFLFECKNLAPSNLHPKTAFEFRGGHLENVRQAARLADGLRRHPEILTDAGGPDPNGMTIVPVVLYAMPFALRGCDRGVYTADFPMLSRFFRSKDLAIETAIDAGGGRARIHRQVTERLWHGDRPTPADLLRALADPWGVRYVEQRTVTDWSLISLASYQLARSPDHRMVELSREQIAALYGIDLRAWDKGIERVRGKAAAERRRRERRELVVQARRFRGRNGAVENQ